jgi:hypothetical protein
MDMIKIDSVDEYEESFGLGVAYNYRFCIKFGQNRTFHIWYCPSYKDYRFDVPHTLSSDGGFYIYSLPKFRDDQSKNLSNLLKGPFKDENGVVLFELDENTISSVVSMVDEYLSENPLY